MASAHGPQRLAVAFDDICAVANAGLVLAAEALTRLGALAATENRLRRHVRPWFGQ